VGVEGGAGEESVGVREDKGLERRRVCVCVAGTKRGYKCSIS
jgi:hypothetical protein